MNANSPNSVNGSTPTPATQTNPRAALLQAAAQARPAQAQPTAEPHPEQAQAPPQPDTQPTPQPAATEADRRDRRTGRFKPRLQPMPPDDDAPKNALDAIGERGIREGGRGVRMQGVRGSVWANGRENYAARWARILQPWQALVESDQLDPERQHLPPRAGVLLLFEDYRGAKNQTKDQDNTNTPRPAPLPNLADLADRGIVAALEYIAAGGDPARGVYVRPLLIVPLRFAQAPDQANASDISPANAPNPNPWANRGDTLAGWMERAQAGPAQEIAQDIRLFIETSGLGACGTTVYCDDVGQKAPSDAIGKCSFEGSDLQNCTARLPLCVVSRAGGWLGLGWQAGNSGDIPRTDPWRDYRPPSWCAPDLVGVLLEVQREMSENRWNYSIYTTLERVAARLGIDIDAGLELRPTVAERGGAGRALLAGIATSRTWASRDPVVVQLLGSCQALGRRNLEALGMRNEGNAQMAMFSLRVRGWQDRLPAMLDPLGRGGDEQAGGRWSPVGLELPPAVRPRMLDEVANPPIDVRALAERAAAEVRAEAVQASSDKRPGE
jgi:hypothetical protein